MPRRNIANRTDIQPDALRQRRDFYAIAIGLMLFYAAGGGFSQDANIGSMFAVHLKRPEFILGAAWVGFAYFWFRFWLITEAKPFVDFAQDAKWQAEDSSTVRRIASKHVTRQTSGEPEDLAQAILQPGNYVPKIVWKGLTPHLQLMHLRRKRGDDFPKTFGPNVVELDSKERAAIWRASLLGYPKAMWWERSFTDYTAPHLFALLTVGVMIWACLHGEPETTKPRARPEASSKVAPEVQPAAPSSVTRSVTLAPPAAASTTVPKSPNVSPNVALKSAVTR
jgi:hypothetical protein